ncbi:MAG: hypothetical protein HYZ24_02065 [Chloroflexi bacterium]|nr:hypothetical protein [Chloroflexota bacterium]
MHLNKNNVLALFLILATLVLSSIPNWAGYTAETEDLAYKGAFFDPQDYAVHISMMRAGMQGDWSYQFRFTTEPHLAAYTRLFYVALGESNRLFNLAPETLFEIARWVFGFVALLALYALIERIFKETFWRNIAFLIAVFGSGLGWLQLILGWVPGQITPIDFWFIDAYVLFGTALFPHFSFATAALCLIFALHLDFLEQGGWGHIGGIVLVAVLTQFVNPIAIVLVDAAIMVITFAIWIQKRRFNSSQAAALGVIAAAQVPLLVYNLRLLTLDPVWSLFTTQNETLSPPAVYYTWGFGLLWLFAAIGFAFALRNKQAPLLGATAWIVTALALAYVPFAIQRRFLHGITIPLALLSAEGLRQTALFIRQKSMLSARIGSMLALLLTLLTTISSISLILGRGSLMRNHPEESFYPASLDPAFEWLNQYANMDDFVLSSAPSGLLIAQKTNLRVYLGHQMETLRFTPKLITVESFYKGNADPNWLDFTIVQWVFHGPYEQALFGSAKFQIEELEISFESGEVTIYHVRP